MSIISGGSRIPQRGERQAIIWPNICQKQHENERKWIRKERWGPLDPPKSMLKCCTYHALLCYWAIDYYHNQILKIGLKNSSKFVKKGLFVYIY